jgi:DNA-binding transcriptional ArsR family regulator
MWEIVSSIDETSRRSGKYNSGTMRPLGTAMRDVSVDGEPDVAAVAALLGEPARAAMCLALADGRALPAGELALRAGVSPQTASNHLEKLLRGRVLSVEQQGRWRYYRLSGEEVARAVEALAVIAPRVLKASARNGSVAGPLREARTCYGHFAGRFGVALTDALLDRGWIELSGRAYVVTDEGIARFAELGIEVRGLRRGPRGLGYTCLDWSERRHHMAGPLATEIVKLAFAWDWVRRVGGTRAVVVTPAGRRELRRLLDLRLGEARRAG